jgi:UDP-glucose 4-epimerase
MKALVTGVAGFIGSHLAERLIQDGYEVCGIDRYLENYPRRWKEENLRSLLQSPRFRLIEADLVQLPLTDLLRGMRYVFHLAAQPGVRASWGKEFEQYTHNNILATQILLESCKKSGIQKFVFASSSSVYGDTTDLPMREDGLARPVSPYGMSKLAGEHLCYLYESVFGVPAVSLRYFTVYGPRQRPDMGFHIFMRALLTGTELPLYDDGEQSRDFTFVSDIVRGTIAAALYPGSGDVFNLGGGCRTTLNQVLKTVERISGRKMKLRKLPHQAGDVRHTSAELARARDKLGFTPEIGLEDGLTQEWKWLVKILK